MNAQITLVPDIVKPVCTDNYMYTASVVKSITYIQPLECHAVVIKGEFVDLQMLESSEAARIMSRLSTNKHLRIVV